MAQELAKDAIKKLEDELTCAVCLDAFKEPKVLHCFHIFCKNCLKPLLVHDQEGQHTLHCPTCRQYTVLPPTAVDVSSLQSAFHIHHLLEIKDALEKLKEPKEVKCDKCNTPRLAISYCRDCGHFICEICCTVHNDWDAFAKHEVVAIEQLEDKVKQLDTLKKVTLYCSQHKGKELELYCETCEELICHNCTISKHCRPEHQYNLITDTFEKHKADIASFLQPVNQQLLAYGKAKEHVRLCSQQLDDQESTVEASIQQEAEEFHKLIEERKAKQIGSLHQVITKKKKCLSAQNDELEAAQTKLASCQSFVKDSMKSGSQVEVMKIKATMTKQIKKLTSSFKPDILLPCEPANVKFISSVLPIGSQLQKFESILLQQIISPEKCFAVGQGLELAEPRQTATVVLHVVDHNGKAYSTSATMEKVTCKLVSEITGENSECSVKSTKDNLYEISYQPTRRGTYQLHIKVEERNIKGSPFPITVKLPVEKLGTPMRTISGLNYPWGVAVNKRGEVIVAEAGGQCISIFSPTGSKFQSFGSKGSGPGQFIEPRYVAVDEDCNILVVEWSNCRIQKFTSEGKYITAVGRKGNQPLEFALPMGIAIHPLNKKVYVADQYNHRIQILNSDLTFSSSFGCQGSNNGQFKRPWDVAFDSTGNVYVADCGNHCIQVFSAKGSFLLKFGKRGNDHGELDFPSSITIDNQVIYVSEMYNHRISVFTCEGVFLTSFGTKGSDPGQFNYPGGTAIDKNHDIVVSDCENNRLQFF